MVFYYFGISKGNILPTLTTPPVSTGSSNQILTIIKANDSIGNWKTYKGRGFELKYPPSWDISKEYADMVGDIPVLTNSLEESVKITVKFGPGGSYGITATREPTIQKIGNTEWELRQADSEGPSYIGQKILTSWRLYTLGNINNPDFAFSVVVPINFPKELPIINQILSTFKFTQ